MILYVPILITDNTRVDWLVALTDQLSEVPFVEWELFSGASNIAEVPYRRYEILESFIPDHVQHVMWMDPDDLIYVDRLISLYHTLSIDDSVVVKEELFNDVDDSIKTQHCCRVIATVSAAKQAAQTTLKRNIPERFYAIEILKRGGRQVDDVVYRWRQYER